MALVRQSELPHVQHAEPSRMRPRILLAATRASAADIRACLGSAFEYCETDSPEAAEATLATQKIDLVIVGYHFDSLHPYRLIQGIRESPSTAHLPILLVRALRLFQNHSEEDQIRESYLILGATAFFSLRDEEKRLGTAKAEENFRDLVSFLLSSEE